MHSESSVDHERASSFLTAEFRGEEFSEERRRKFFRLIATFAFPIKTAACLRAETGYPERTINDWLAGRSNAPWAAYVAIFAAIERSS
jgi:hypothetical protein